MTILAQSVAVDVVPYLHMGYTAAAWSEPALVGALAIPFLLLALLFWREELFALLQGLCAFAWLRTKGLAVRVVRRQGRTRGPS